MVSRVAVSAQCRSSTISSTGDRSASRWNSPKSASNSLRLHPFRLDGSLVKGAEGGHEARQVVGRQVLPRLRSQPDRGLIASPRSASTNGPYGRLEPTDVAAIAAQHAEPAVAGEARSLARQPRLADAGLAGDEQMDGLAAGGAVQRALDGVELRIAADDDRAADAGRHGREDTRGPGRTGNRHTSRASG